MACARKLALVSAAMCRAANAQAGFWMKVDMLAETNLTASFHGIVTMRFAAARTRPAVVEA